MPAQTMQKSGRKKPPARKLRGAGSRFLLAVAAAACLAFCLLFLVLVFGPVRGAEFSPDSLRIREFSYLQVPVINFQVTPAKRRPIKTGLGSYLRKEGYVKSGSEQWEVARAAGSRIDYTGDADIVLQYFQSESKAGQNPWVTWSENNPALAEVLWPEIVGALRERRYVAIPSLLQLARKSVTPAQLSSDLEAFYSSAESWLAELEDSPPEMPLP